MFLEVDPYWKLRNFIWVSDHVWNQKYWSLRPHFKVGWVASRHKEWEALYCLNVWITMHSSVSPWSHSEHYTQLYSSDRNSCVKTEKGNPETSLTASQLANHGIKWPWMSDCQFRKVTEIIFPSTSNQRDCCMKDSHYMFETLRTSDAPYHIFTEL